MSRALCIAWLRGEMTVPASRYFAREVLGAIESDIDLSTEALKWLDSCANSGRWTMQANACLDELDRIAQRDAEPFAPPESGEVRCG